MRIRAFLLATVACVLTACGSQASTSDLLMVTPDPRITAQPVSDTSFTCKPVLPTPGATRSEAVLEGPCAFTFTAAAKCINKTDDFYANIQLPLNDDGKLNLNINLEHFNGPGRYEKKSQLVLTVTRGVQIGFWQQLAGTVELSKDAKKVTIPPLSMPASLGNVIGGTETVRGVLACA